MIDPETIRPLMDDLLRRFDRSYLEPDPLAAALPYQHDSGDLETAALIAALFAYGRADQIQKTVTAILGAMEGSPARFCEDFVPLRYRNWMPTFRYRFNTRDDLTGLLTAIGAVRREYGGLAPLFHECDPDPNAETFMRAISGTTKILRSLAGRNTKSFRYLITDPVTGSAAKRWCLYLRWMIRKDSVDPGPWHNDFATSRLVMPLDTHVGRIARLLGLLARKSDDGKAALELTRFFRRLDPNDPVKYDFALCSFGKLGHCTRRIDPDQCAVCSFSDWCAKKI